jgi:hypothetical protein
MKPLKKILLYALLPALFGLASCDFLDKEPENKVPEKNVDFTQTANMYQAVSGVYAKIRTGGMHWIIWPLTIVRDDDVWSGRTDDQQGLVDMGNFNYDNTFWGLNEMWNQYYGIIKVANAALESLDSYAEYITSDADRANYLSYCGEVRYLRAYAYYRLVQTFGAVTILRENTQTDMTRSTVAAVDRYMLEDLQFTMDNTPRLRPNEMEHIGAVTAFSAEALAAKIQLNQGNYDQVEKLTDDIIGSGKFSLYADFYNLFKIPGKLCDESLFECQLTDFGLSSGDMIDADQWFVFQGPANDGDISGWGFIGIEKPFRQWAADRGEGIRATTSFLLAGTTTPSGDVIKPQDNPEANDCWNGKAYTPLNQLTPGRTKYGTNNNIRIFRYADVLLMNAEAKVRLGKSGDAPLNLVRRRAGMADITNATVDQILDERRMELSCEWGERYNDLVRTGQAASVLGAKGWSEEKTYYPLPFEQVANIESLSNEPKDE